MKVGTGQTFSLGTSTFTTRTVLEREQEISDVEVDLEHTTITLGIIADN